MSVATVEQTSSQASATDAIRVAVVDDSAVVRGLVSKWVNEDSDLDVVGRYANGKLAVEQISESCPDVIILDIEMPVMDGMTALPELLKVKPGVKVIMASTLTKRNAEVSMRALSMGATDYIPKPEGNRGVTSSKDFRVELIRKIKAITRRPRRLAATSTPAHSPAGIATPSHDGAKQAAVATAGTTLRKFSQVRPRILAIGCSTGGPQALMQVLGDIDLTALQVPIVITQHMPATFTAILAEHLSRTTQIESREAEHGEEIEAGKIYVAPGGQHMALQQSENGARVRIYDGPDVNFCKPAVDPLFESVASVFGTAALALVLTGMGHDGAEGALQIANSGGSVIAQDEASSVVWGMPGAAAAAGACAAILPLEKIGPKVASIFQGVTA